MSGEFRRSRFVAMGGYKTVGENKIISASNATELALLKSDARFNSMHNRGINFSQCGGEAVARAVRWDAPVRPVAFHLGGEEGRQGVQRQSRGGLRAARLGGSAGPHKVAGGSK
jgi:hypothetical protein